MNRQLDVDQILRSWLAEGAEWAPEHHVATALERIDAMTQRRPMRMPAILIRSDGTPAMLRIAAIGMAAVALLATVGLGIGLQIGLIRLPHPQPAPTLPGPTAPVSPAESSDAERDSTLVLFFSPDDGYELGLPRVWEEVGVPSLDREPAAGVRRFSGPADVGAYPILTVSIGDSDGTIRICQLSCREVAGQVSLDILEETLISSPEEAGWSQVHGDTVLGGETARFEHPDTGGIISAGNRAYYHVFAIHGGRPVVLSFDYWAVRRHDLDGATVDQIIEGLRFTD